MIKELFVSALLSSAIGSPLAPLNDTNALSGVNAYYIGDVDLEFSRNDYLPFGGVVDYDNTVDNGSGILCLHTRFKTRCKVALDLDTLENNIPSVFIHFNDMEIYFNAYCQVYDDSNYDDILTFNNFVNSAFSLNSELFPVFLNRYESVTGNTYNVVGDITYLSQDTLTDVFLVTFSQRYDGYDIPLNIFDGLAKVMTDNLFYNAHFGTSLNDYYYINLFSTTENMYERNPIPQIYETFREYYYGVVSDDHQSYMYQRGYDVGYNEGYESGYSIGFNVGYNQALEADHTAIAIFNGILSIGMLPINFFLAIFNFEILGINITNFVSALLSMCLVIIVIRMVVGSGADTGS